VATHHTHHSLDYRIAIIPLSQSPKDHGCRAGSSIQVGPKTGVTNRFRSLGYEARKDFELSVILKLFLPPAQLLNNVERS
jgi:hypothetical protein